MGGKSDEVKLESVTKLEWDHPIKLEIIDVQPPEGGSFLRVPGPKQRPVRPYLEPFASPGGLVARVFRGDGQAMPIALLVHETPTIIDLSAPPLALTVRQDGGIWVLHRGTLIHRDAVGNPVQTLSLDGMTLVGSADNAVWVVGLDEAWLVAAEGHVHGPYPWKAGFGSVGSGSLLCALEKQKPRNIQCLNADGAEKSFSLPSPPTPFEKLLTFKDGLAITQAGSKLRFYGKDGITTTLTVQSVGLTSANEAFVSGRQENEIILYINQDTPKRLHLPANIATQGAFPVVAVEGERILASAFDNAVWYDDEQITDTFIVDEQRYRNDVFPYAWNLGSPNFATADSEGTVILSATGPEGLVLLSIQLDS